MEKIFLTGGSGTVGSAFISEFYGKYKFYSFSRNEKMQVALKRNFPDVVIILGSVDDKITIMSSIYKCMPDIVIHAAAMKHVDSAEKSPIGAVKSNVIGSLNLIEACIEAKIASTIAISTDKACSPDSIYGQTKYLMEKMFLEAHTDKMKFNVCRFGNVAHSHGSVLPYWLRLISQNKTLPLTDKRMNRLILSKREAAEIVNDALIKARSDNQSFILTKAMKTVNMYTLASLISDNIEIVGLRDGEKLNETLISEDELHRTFIDDRHITIRSFENTGLNRLPSALSSENAEKMSESEILSLISDTSEFMEETALQSKIY